MKSKFLSIVLLASSLSIGTISLLFSQPISAQSKSSVVGELKTSSPIKELLTQTEPAKIISVKIAPGVTGIEIAILQGRGSANENAPGAALSPSITRTQGNIFYIDIPNAVLALPDLKEFRAENPAQGIANISVSQVSPSLVRVTITGTDGLPNAQLVSKEGDLVITLTPLPAASQTSDAEIEINVVGLRNRRGYRMPNTSTATKTDTPLRDIPQSIQVVPRQIIEDRGVTRVGEIAQNVSGVTVTTGPSGVGEQFTIRGFSGGEFGSGNEFRNGFRSLGLGTFNPGNIERVEVLKGPASVLYGQIEPGGMINFVTKKPLDRPSYAVDMEVGNFGYSKPALDISGPLSADKKSLYRLNTSYEKSGSFVNFVNRDILQFSPSVTYDLSDRSKLTFDYEYIRETGINNPGLPRSPLAFQLPRNLFLGEPDDRVDSKSQSFNVGLDHQFSQDWQLRSQANWQNESFKRNAHRIGRVLNEENTLNRFLQNDTEDNADNYSIQTNLIGKVKTGSIDHQLLFGLEWNKFNDLDATGFSNVGPIDVFNPIYNTAVRPTLFDDSASRLTTNSTTTSFYLQDQVTLLPNLKLLVGGRYDSIDETSGSQDLDVDGTTPISDITSSSFSSQAFSPRIGFVYQPIEPVSLYASYSTSFVPNNTLTRTGTPIDPTKANQLEIGVKTDIFDGKLSATLAAYQITKTNVLTIDPVDTDFSIPIGEVRSRGIELDLTGKIQPGWNIIGSLFVNESTVTVGDDDSPVGNILINAPRSGASLWSTYEIQAGNYQGLGFGGGVFYVGDVQATLPNTFLIPAYFRTDAAIFYKRDNWKAALNFKNLFNVNSYSAQSGGIYPGDPFTVLASFGVNF
jgi:iron complex outermembrane recepter protein